MGNALLMKVTNCQSNLGCVELDNILLEPLFALEDLIELSSSDEGHYEVKSELRLKEEIHAN